MNSNEVRQGNLVLYDDRIFQIDTIASEFPTLNTDEFGIGVVGWMDIEPIPLTIEWIRRWFYHNPYQSNAYSDEKTYYHIVKKDDKFIFRGLGSSIVHLQGVHHLQNLYFALTGIELEIK